MYSRGVSQFQVAQSEFELNLPVCVVVSRPLFLYDAIVWFDWPSPSCDALRYRISSLPWEQVLYILILHSSVLTSTRQHIMKLFPFLVDYPVPTAQRLVDFFAREQINQRAIRMPLGSIFISTDFLTKYEN